MALDPKSRPYTAFTVPGMGQFEWKVVSMGLALAPSAFQRLVELVVKGINNVVVYIDYVVRSMFAQMKTTLDRSISFISDISIVSYNIRLTMIGQLATLL